jgi:hypothetical protein
MPGKETMDMVKQLLTVLIDHHQEQIDRVVERDRKIEVALKVRMKRGAEHGAYELEAHLAFVKEQIKDKIAGTIKEGQGGLFQEGSDAETRDNAGDAEGAALEVDRAALTEGFPRMLPAGEETAEGEDGALDGADTGTEGAIR